MNYCAQNNVPRQLTIICSRFVIFWYFCQAYNYCGIWCCVCQLDDKRDVLLQVIKMLVIVVALFALCWLPLQSYNVLQDIYPEINGFVDFCFSRAALCFVIINWQHFIIAIWICNAQQKESISCTFFFQNFVIISNLESFGINTIAINLF